MLSAVAWCSILHCCQCTMDLIQLHDVSMKLHEASWRHQEHLLWGWTHIANTLKLCTPGIMNECSHRVYGASNWLLWTSVWHWHHFTAWAKLTMALVAACQFHLTLLLRYSMLGINVKYIYQCVGGTQLILGSHQSKIHKSTTLKRQDGHYW